MKENIEVKTEQQTQQGHDYFLYFSYIVLIAVIGATCPLAIDFNTPS